MSKAENEYGNDFIVLTDEEGVEEEFEHIDTLEYNGETYVALIPAHEDPDDLLSESGELVILKISEDENGEEILSSIDDEALLDELFLQFSERLEDLFEIEENEESILS